MLQEIKMALDYCLLSWATDHHTRRRLESYSDYSKDDNSTQGALICLGTPFLIQEYNYA